MRHQIDWAALGRLHAMKQPRLPPAPLPPPKPAPDILAAFGRQADRLWAGHPFTAEEVASVLRDWEAEAVQGLSRKALQQAIRDAFPVGQLMHAGNFEARGGVDADGRWSLTVSGVADWLS